MPPGWPRTSPAVSGQGRTPSFRLRDRALIPVGLIQANRDMLPGGSGLNGPDALQQRLFALGGKGVKLLHAGEAHVIAAGRTELVEPVILAEHFAQPGCVP